MSNPLPEPVIIGMEEVNFNEFEPRYGFTADQLRAHAAAELAAAKDCHTCKHFAVCLSPHHQGKDCTDADRYEALPPVRLWRKK